MSTPENAARTREHLANERTFLAWIRTSLGLIGLGFVVARIGLFLHEMTEPTLEQELNRGSEFVLAGTGILLFGVLLTVWSGYGYRRARIAIDIQRFEPSRWSIFTVTLIVTAGGIGLIVLVLWRLLFTG